MSYTTPDVSYSIKVANLKFNTVGDIAVGAACRVSYNCKIIITLIPNNCGLDQFDVRATTSDASWDIDQGNLLSRSTNLSQSVAHSCEFYITKENFPSAGEYRIGLYARNALDGSWDVTYLFITLDGCSFQLSDGSMFGTLTDRNIPSN
jgi:hypothetical protein